MSAPLTSRGATPTKHAAPPLNAVLEVLVLPLTLTVAQDVVFHGAQVHGADRLASHERQAFSEVFSHSRFLEGEHEPVGGAGLSELEGFDDLLDLGDLSDPEDVHDIGFGVARPVATRVDIVGDGPQLWFGRSRASIRDHEYDDIADADYLWHLRPSVAVTLWTVGTRGVLTVERLAPLDPDGLQPHSGEWTKVAADVSAALPRMLAHHSGSTDRSLADLFGNALAVDLAGAAATEPLTHLLTPAMETVRGRQVHEGLLAVVAPEATTKLAAFLDTSDEDRDFERSEFQQATGVTGHWDALPLVEQPAELGATSVVRDDVRAAIINLEALSVQHDYAGVGGGGLILATIPYVAHRATIAELNADAADLVGALAAGRQAPPNLVARVNRSRARVLDVKLQRRRVSLEKFTDWTCPGQLVTLLAEKRRAKDDQLLADAEEAMKFVERSAAEADRRAAEDREVAEKRIASVVKIGAPIVALASLAGVSAAMTTISSADGTGTLLSLGGSLLVLLVLCCIGGAIGWAIHRVRGGAAGWDGACSSGIALPTEVHAPGAWEPGGCPYGLRQAARACWVVVVAGPGR